MFEESHEELSKTYSNGIRFTSDAADCALPISIDPRNFCRYGCLYCFSENLMRNKDRNRKVKRGEWPVDKLERFLNREYKNPVAQAMYPLLDAGCPVQLGALGEPFDEAELDTGWAKQAIPLFVKHKIPVRISTKGGRVLQRPEYLKLFENNPKQFWFAFSIICNDDDLISQIDLKAPHTSERLKAMKALTDIGCKASLRFRPFLPGVSDTYPGGPANAWEILIKRAHQAGARAISFEWIFLNRSLTDNQKKQYDRMFDAMGNPNFGAEWAAESHTSETCRRGSRKDKYEMTMKIRDKVHSLGWSFGCSDPHFKEWGDSGACCGFREDDPWFGRYSRRQMTEVLIQAKRSYDTGRPKMFTYNHWRPEWAHQIKAAACISFGDKHTHKLHKDQTFGDTLRNKWNNPEHPRGPEIYFGGVLKAIGKDRNSNDMVYEYEPYKREE
jgi:DNA repair photolyase